MSAAIAAHRQAHPALGNQLRDHQLHRRDVRRQTPQPPVELGLIWQVGNNPGNSRLSIPKN
jgi:hypothetical protein